MQQYIKRPVNFLERSERKVQNQSPEEMVLDPIEGRWKSTRQKPSCLAQLPWRCPDLLTKNVHVKLRAMPTDINVEKHPEA